MRKSDFRSCENKGTDQLRSNCFCYSDSIIPLLSKSKISTLVIFCACTARFVSDLVGNPEDWFVSDLVGNPEDWFMSDLVGNSKDWFSHIVAHLVFLPCQNCFVLEHV